MSKSLMIVISLMISIVCAVACLPQPQATPPPYPGSEQGLSAPEHPPTDAPGVPPVKWVSPPQPGLGVAAAKFAVQVIEMGIQPDRLTILYAIALAPSVLGSGSSFSVTLPSATRIIANQQPFGRMLRSASLRSVADVNVGVAIFGFGSPRGGIVSLQIPGLQVTKPGMAPTTLSDSVEIQLLQDIAPNIGYAFSYQGAGGITERQVGSLKLTSLAGTIYFNSPKGTVETLGVDMGAAGGVYVLVNDRAEITQLKESEFNNMESYLLTLRTGRPSGCKIQAWINCLISTAII